MRIRWTKPAAADFSHICDYTEQRFGAVQARRAALAIYDRAESIPAFPEQGRRGRKSGTRELTVPGTPFLIIYRRTEVIEILRILHGAQKWP